MIARRIEFLLWVGRRSLFEPCVQYTPRNCAGRSDRELQERLAANVAIVEWSIHPTVAQDSDSGAAVEAHWTAVQTFVRDDLAVALEVFDEVFDGVRQTRVTQGSIEPGRCEGR